MLMSLLSGISLKRADDSKNTLHSAELLQLKYTRANALISSIINKYYNGSSRAVDPFVIRCVQEEETRLYSIQHYVEQGPVERSRSFKDSNVVKKSIRDRSLNFITRWFGICGGFFGPGSVMRKWDMLSEGGFEQAMEEYISVVDKILPGWDQPPEFPVANQEKFWKDDSTAGGCTHCMTDFGLQTRRHHCRMCFEIFCATCCDHDLEMALCPGAPIRRQRVCVICLNDAERSKGLLEVRRLIRENHDIEQQIKEIQQSTEALIHAKQEEEQELRQKAAASGCDLVALESAIQRKIGSPVSINVKTPPAHKFAPRETLEANEQVALANRQLVMGLKVAQCRSKKAIEKMDITLSVLRNALSVRPADWAQILVFVQPFLTFQDLRLLRTVSRTFLVIVHGQKLEHRCVLLASRIPSRVRYGLWQSSCLVDPKTQSYLVDLAEAIRSRLCSSDSETESTDENDIIKDQRSDLVERLICWAPHSSNGSKHQGTVGEKDFWTDVYHSILSRCAHDVATEHDTQILTDVNRTFGSSPLRKSRRKSYTSEDFSSVLKNGDHELKVCLPLSAEQVSLQGQQQSLRNVLRAFASINTDIGYCQGMDYVTALLLSVVDWDEAHAFWLLTSFIAAPRYQLSNLYCSGIPHFNMRVYQLEKLCEKYLRNLYFHFQKLDFPLSMVTTGWFMTLFTNMEALPYDVVLRVLDGFLTVGWEHFFRVALAVLELLRERILSSSFEQIPSIFYGLPHNTPTLFDAHTLLEKAQAFDVSSEDLAELEQQYHRAVSLRQELSTTKATKNTAKQERLKKLRTVDFASVKKTPVPQASGDNEPCRKDGSMPNRASVRFSSSLSTPLYSPLVSHSSPSTTASQPMPIPKTWSWAMERDNCKGASPALENNTELNFSKSPDTPRAASPLAITTVDRASYDVPPVNASHFY